MAVIHEHKWTTFEAFDFKGIITAQDQALAKKDILDLIESGNYFKNSPPFQTNQNIFQSPEAHWLKLRMSFIFSCFMYLGKEVKIDQIQSWGYMTSSLTTEDPEAYWHTHQYGTERTLSGIYYLHIPEDADKEKSGTEFAPEGVDQPDRWISPVLDYHWLIYPGKTWHRPSVPTSKENRFVVAADMVIA
jgi:hypothetical protein